MSQAANGLACCCLRKIAAHLSPYSKPERLIPHPTTPSRASQSCVTLRRLPQETASSSGSSAATRLPRPTAPGEVPTAVPRRGAPLRIEPLQDLFLGGRRVNRLGRMEPPPPSTSHTTPPEEFAPAARGCALAAAVGASRRRSMEAIVCRLAGGGPRRQSLGGRPCRARAGCRSWRTRCGDQPRQRLRGSGRWGRPLGDCPRTGARGGRRRCRAAHGRGRGS
jgi:hypothetical protein